MQSNLKILLFSAKANCVFAAHLTMCFTRSGAGKEECLLVESEEALLPTQKLFLACLMRRAVGWEEGQYLFHTLHRYSS